MKRTSTTVQVFSELQARDALRKIGVQEEKLRLTLREMTCKEDFFEEQIVNEQVVRVVLFHRYHKYYMWVALPRDGSYQSWYWMVRATAVGAENIFEPNAVKVPRRVFNNPLEASIAQKIRPAKQEFVQVDDFAGSKLLLPAENLKISVVAKKMSALLGITPAQVLPRIFGTEKGWFIGILLREKHPNGYSDYVVDCYRQKVFNRAGFEYLQGRQRVPGEGNLNSAITREIPLGAHQKTIRWGGMRIRYNEDKKVINIKMTV